jgi:hypothetical protein
MKDIQFIKLEQALRIAEKRKVHIERQNEGIRDLKRELAALNNKVKDLWKLECGHFAIVNSYWNVPGHVCDHCKAIKERDKAVDLLSHGARADYNAWVMNIWDRKQ